MPIQFTCGRCHRELSAPDNAGGKRGKCPHCGHSNYVPLPKAPEADDDIPLVEVDEEEERRVERELLEAERDLLAESRRGEDVPLEHRDDLTPEDLHHFVVNYCLDMAAGNLERAARHVQKLKTFRGLGREAVADFLGGKVSEPAMGNIPPPVVQGFLRQLREQLG